MPKDAISYDSLLQSQNCRHSYSEADEIAERSLWRAVITQVMLDISCQSKQRKKQRNKIRTLKWLKEGGADFDAVCELAGYHPENVRKKIFTAMRNGCQWRQDKREYVDLLKEFEDC